MSSVRKVVILQHRMLHYRIKLFELLRERCSKHNVEICLVHGQPTYVERKKNDVGDLKWADVVKNRYFSVGNRDILWQPFPDKHTDADMIVMMQESRLISNYRWLFGSARSNAKLAYWGHGRNFQSSYSTGLREKWKKKLVTRVDWWFAYTEMTKRIVREAHYPTDRITVLNNAIDNQGFADDLASVHSNEIAALRASIGCIDGAPLALFCGSLYPEKRLDLLVSACRQVIDRRPDFKVVVIGDGPSKALLETPDTAGWMHCVGAKRGRDKAAWFKASQIYLNPGLVGLHVLDSFVAGTPMITTEDALHSPEVEYLQHSHNGLFTAGTSSAYAQAILDLLGNEVLLKQLRSNALASAELFTLDAMVERFTQGIVECLDRPRLRAGSGS